MSGRKNKSKKKHVIPHDVVFKPDPFGDLEDTRPVEVRKGRKRKPDRVIPWEAIKNA